MTKLIGNNPNQVPSNADLGTAAFMDKKDFLLSKGSSLSAIDAVIPNTAVDVFIYDTSKDSDGGAWRKRTQHTSWYNERLNTTTRGSRREFPVVAVIVVTAASTRKLYIYDGDDPNLPMWMIIDTTDGQWPQAEFSSLYALNGIIALGSASNIQPAYETRNRLDLYYFVSDKIESSGTPTGGNYYGIVDGLVNRTIHSTNRGSPVGNSVYNLANMSINDVAMTVLPNAPIDSATGLPVPTIAVATNGGVSVIKDDGSVVDIADSENAVYHQVDFSGEQLFIQSSYLDYSPYVVSIPNSDVTGFNRTAGEPSNTKEDYRSTGSTSGINLADLRFLAETGQADKPMIISGDERFISSSQGLSKIAANRNLPSEGMVSYITSTYNTGWMNGDIKLATLSDTDATNAVGTELVTNSTFSDTSVWSLGTGWSISGGKLRKSDNSNVSAMDTITTVIGKTYTISVTVDTGADGSYIYAGNNFNSDNMTSAGQYSRTFTAVSTSTLVGITGVSGNGLIADDFSVRLAEKDRSVNSNGLQVFGTVKKTPVAAGADLVAYSGFSTSNYLQQPYNADLDFGTGDFCIMGWIKDSSYTDIYNDVLDKAEFGTNNQRLEFLFSSKVLRLTIGSATVISGDVGVPNVWQQVAAVRRNGVVSLYVDGNVVATGTSTGSVSNTSHKMWVGVNYNGSNEGDNKQLALLRISATAPSPEQIKKIYEDEKVLFQENAKCTLYGSSDAVTALAYDDDTELLHVGTSAGRSVFQGLRRVDNTTRAVGTAISAVDGFVVEE